MSNITDIYWEFNGLSLHTHAWAIDTFGGPRYKPASKRGEDLKIPLFDGAIYTKKARDSRTESLRMWLYDVDPDGARYSGLTPEQALHKNWEIFTDAISNDGASPFVKRWWDGSSVVRAEGVGEVLEFPEPSSTGKLQRFQLDVFMADPWFYGAPITHGAGTFTVEGNETTKKAIFDLTVTGPAHVTMSDGNEFFYLGGAGHLIVDASTGLATLGGAPVNGMMRKNQNFWQYAELKPGNLTLTFVSGISSGSLTYSPAFH